METILFLLDGIVVALVCYMAMKDDRRPRGTPATSLFRFRDTLAPRPVERRFVAGSYRADVAINPRDGRRR